VTWRAALSSRIPLNDGWRICPSRVQAVNSTSATWTGSTQRASLASARGTSTKGGLAPVLVELGGDLAAQSLREPRPHLADIDQPAALVIADQERAERPAGGGRAMPAPDDELPAARALRLARRCPRPATRSPRKAHRRPPPPEPARSDPLSSRRLNPPSPYAYHSNRPTTVDSSQSNSTAEVAIIGPRLEEDVRSVWGK
jgi:hypothetical protein